MEVHDGINPLWNQNTKIKGKFSWLSYYSLYIGLLPNAQEYEPQDFIEIMSFFSAVGYEEVSEEEAKKHSILPTGNYAKFLRLEKV